MPKYIGKRKLVKILQQCAPYSFKMKDCDYDNWFGDECVSYVANNLQFCIFARSYGAEFCYIVNKISDLFDYCPVFEEKIHPIFIEK